MPRATSKTLALVFALAAAEPWAAVAQVAPALRGSAEAEPAEPEAAAQGEEAQPQGDQLLASLDINGDGEVQFDEASRLFEHPGGQQEVGEVSAEVANAESETSEEAAPSNEEHFAAADADGSGGLNRKELDAATALWSVDCSQARVPVFCQDTSLVRCCYNRAMAGNWVRCGTQASAPSCSGGGGGGFGPGGGGGFGPGGGGGFGPGGGGGFGPWR